MESSLNSQEVSLQFVIPQGLTEETCAPSLICAYQASVENELEPSWKTAEECLALKPTKRDVFICEPFEGEVFDYLKSDNVKCVVLGPRCFLSCLHRKISVPELPWPVHNISMHKLIITLTGFEKEEKEELSQIITKSAGIYSNNFSEAVTHLVANSVGSRKYVVAIEKEVPVMTGEWLRAVWKTVCRDFREDIYATDEQFLSYTCPLFKNLVICISQMPRKNKETLKKIIEENGGTYSASLEMSVTSVLIIPTPEGEKYDHARNWRVQCLTPDWIYDSLEIGHTLNMEAYEVKRRGASTPTDENATNVPPDVSMCSTIMNETELNRGSITHVNETLQQSTLAETSILKRNSLLDENALRGLSAVENLDLQQAMKAGSFLDGCKIFLSGFSGSHMEKLRRIMNAGGASRFSQLSESVSHVIIGKVVEEHMNTIMSWNSKPHVVYGDWIAESIKLQKPADEGPFSYQQNNQQSPKSRRISVRKMSADNETFVDEDLMSKYLKPPRSSDARRSNGAEDSMNLSSFPDSQESTVQGIFSGKVYTISGYSQRITEDYITTIREHGGEVVSMDYKGHVNYSVVSMEETGLFHAKADEIVSHYFLQDCFDLDKWEEPKLVKVEYYHLPLYFIKNVSQLTNCTFAISIYSGLERQFLVSLATRLGAQFQESFAKKSNPGKNIKASTHLVCPTASGEKYKAAQKWNVHAITHDWLLACLRSGEREAEELYRVDNPDHEVLDGRKVIRDLLGTQVDVSSSTIGETVVGDSVMDGSVMPTPVNNKVKTLRKESFRSPHEIKTPDIETMRKMYPTPGIGHNDKSLDEMPTPDTPYGRTWNPNPPARVRKAYKRLLDSLPDEPPAKKPADPTTPIEVYYKRFQDKVSEDFKNFRIKTPVWIKKQTSRTKGEEREEVEEEQKANTSGTSEEEKCEEADITVPADKHGPLTGVVVCTAHKLIDQQKDLYNAVVELGGSYSWTLDDNVTHFIFHGQNNDKTKEFRAARDNGKIIVAPDWVWMCHNENKRVDEELFPHTHNPKMALSLLSTKSNIVGGKRGRPKKKPASDDEDKESKVDEETQNSPDDTTKMSEMNESLSRQLEEIEALASVTGAERRSMSRNRSISEKLKHTPTREVQVETQPAMDIPETQSTAITWDDPQEREARMKLQQHLIRDTQEIIEGKNENIEEDKENLPSLEERDTRGESSAMSPDKVKRKFCPIFVISGASDEDRDSYEAIITRLDGIMNTDHFFNTSCTHVVTAKPTRSEKHLAAIASGKWLLHASFLEASAKAGRFVEEELYEWGNFASPNIPEISKDSLEYKLSACARRWRLELSDSSKGKHGAFHGMRALIHSSRDRVEAFSRLIVAGGGEVVTGMPPYTDIENITHCIIESSKNKAKVDLAYFAHQNIPCFGPLYLNQYLVSNPPPDLSEYFIPEYQDILQNLSEVNRSLIKRRK